ncbi:mannose-6-phosphate isomerase, class I [Microlunatus sp. Gsoil 973]|uniref:mannose-6-phosphate isomerase, class I n=1 Tax=Microlunatus sp. Gsoil 973 TaxID=2672569 RepID=UPI0012B4B86F|nr:mannose-6-phosphate isomerase, class I [Microlunatus sp. Gsoil 973]QGN33696.1 mannose-6-phosphate isomerase, class I [Microlunatus sp. Gsoil 973]
MKRLVGRIQPYAWGSTTALPQFLGTEPTDDPQAELWLGAHPLAPAGLVTDEGEQPLDAAIAADPAGWVGAASVDRFGPRLPYLMKVLAAARPLSLQAHPDRAQAEDGFAREEAARIPRDAPERTYRDNWPKPEALCALGDFEALCGFREPAATYQLFTALGVPAATDLVSPLQSGGAAELEQVFGTLLRMPDARSLVIAVARAASVLASEPGPVGRFARTAAEIGSYNPGDPGVLAALLMNRVSLHKYEALYLPAGNLHAYLRGLGVEIMANSDNVLRGGLTGKHIDIDELLRLLDFTPGPVGPVPIEQVSEAVYRYRTQAPEFALWRVDVDHAPSDGTAVPAHGSGRVVLCGDGSVTLRSAGVDLGLGRGQSAYLLPEEAAVVRGAGAVFVGASGLS